MMKTAEIVRDYRYWLLRLQDYCAAAERAPESVRSKLRLSGLNKAEQLQIESELRRGGFLDDARYAEAYVRVKRQAGWGSAKIRSSLLRKGIASALAAEYSSGAEDAERLQEVAARKWKSLRKGDIRERQNKLLRFLLSRGFGMKEARGAVEHCVRNDPD
jgi:regulatory protein